MNQHCNIFGSYFEFVVMIFVAGVDNGSVQVLLSVLVARDAGLITGADDQLSFWDLHWSSFLVGSLVAVVCAVPISLVGLSGLGCRRTHPKRLTSFFCSWS